MILLLLFSISSTIRASNVQKPNQKKCIVRMRRFFSWAQSMNNAAENCKQNSRIFWLGQNMKNMKNSQEMLCNKISENQRKSFLQLLAQGMNKIKKRIYFRALRHSSFLLPPVMECFTKKDAF